MDQAGIEILNHALQDRALTLRNRGGLATLLHLADNLELFMSIDDLTQRLREGYTAVGRMLRELEQHGYLTRRRETVAGRFTGPARWVLRMPPGAASPPPAPAPVPALPR